jgi:hypothetical protein
MMAKEQELMALMAGAGAPAGEPAPGGATAMPGQEPPLSPAPPMASPMGTPEPKAGQKEAALINISMALDLIEQALPAVGSASPEGKKLLSILNSLTGLLGPKKQRVGELQNAEILQLLQNLPQAGGGTPASRMMEQAPPNLGLMSPAGGAMPPGAAPGAPVPPPPGGAGAPPMPM